ncbi:MAG: hypothetical protein Q9187_003312 [Circinaria calcarea]
MNVTSNSAFDDNSPVPIPGSWRDSSAELSDSDVSRVTSVTPNRPRSGTTPKQLTDRRRSHAKFRTLDKYIASVQVAKQAFVDESPSSEVESISDRSSISRASTPLTPPDFAHSNLGKRCRGTPSPSPLGQLRTRASSTLGSSPSRVRRPSAQRPTSILQNLSAISGIQLSIENDTILTSSRPLDQEFDLDSNFSGEVRPIPETSQVLDAVPSFERYHEENMQPNSINNELFRQIRRRELEKKVDAGNILPSNTDLGYIYIFTLPSCPRFIKIGMTIQVPKDRVSQQKYHCKQPYNIVEDPHDKPFRGYGAVEKLIKVELHNLRRKFVCGKCKTTNKQVAREHGEWFEISEEKALEVVERWRQWMVKGKPFDSNGVLTPFWVRRYEEAIQDPTNVRWEEWLCPPIPLPQYHHYLSLVINGGYHMLHEQT